MKRVKKTSLSFAFLSFCCFLHFYLQLLHLCIQFRKFIFTRKEVGEVWMSAEREIAA